MPEYRLKPEYSFLSWEGRSFENILKECERSIAKGNELTEEDVENVLQKLEHYLSYQLNWEEEAMKRSGVPDLEEHLFQQQLFKDKVRSFRQESRFSHETLMTKIHQFAKKWFISHILKK